MGVDRTDYLMWGAKVDPDSVSGDGFEAERYQDEGARFDIIYDGMSGRYAVAGKIVAESDPYEGIDFIEVDASIPDGRERDAIVERVCVALPDVRLDEFKMYLFSHFH